MLLIPNLLLSEKTIHIAEGGADFRTLNSLAKTGETAWAFLRHAHSLVGSQPLSSILVEVLALLAKQSLSRSFDHLQHFTASPDADQGPEAPLSYSEKHQRQVRLGKPQVTDLVEKYLAGASVLMLAEEFGIHRTTVTAHLERHGVPRRACVRRLTDADVQEAACHYVAGESLLNVGRRYGVDPATIAREFRNAGVEIRARRGWTDGPPQAEFPNSDAGE